MRVLVACEFSGIVRDAFISLGHDAFSCDLEGIEPEGKYPNHHLYGNCLWFLTPNNDYHWDLLIAHPPCTHLAVSGARWFKNKKKEQKKAIEFFMELIKVNVPKICVENPICIMSTVYRKPDQIIQPWQFGHGETKKTCLWLKGLPLLKPTNIVSGRENRIWKMPPSPNRGKERSITYTGIAQAMAQQWGNVAPIEIDDIRYTINK